MSEPVVSQKKPFVLEVEAGKHAWCACGRSQKQPYCDGSHRDTQILPIVVDIAEKKLVAWCGCRHSAKKPFCDGSHSKL